MSGRGVLAGSVALPCGADLARRGSRSYIVNEGEQALVVRLGAPVGVIDTPGLQVEGAADRQRVQLTIRACCCC